MEYCVASKCQHGWNLNLNPLTALCTMLPHMLSKRCGALIDRQARMKLGREITQPAIWCARYRHVTIASPPPPYSEHFPRSGASCRCKEISLARKPMLEPDPDKVNHGFLRLNPHLLAALIDAYQQVRTTKRCQAGFAMAYPVGDLYHRRYNLWGCTNS
ncbi:hypothetical protein LIA77_10485 [Sarocladium implicatum]|nr:hypothetical protein LIA77_10485 [Sarocladium implicatum]